jgi:hypothetical protein
VKDLRATDFERGFPIHHTGGKAVHHLARAMPAAFVQPAVGTVVSF